MPERFTADINLTTAEISELCDLTSDAVINALNGTAPTTQERLETLKSLFNKAHTAWGQQIIAPEIGNVIAAAATSGQPVPPEVTAFVASNDEKRIPLEVPSDDEPHTCGHFHGLERDCPADGTPCGDYRCCH